jgi:hypothetical protein
MSAIAHRVRARPGSTESRNARQAASVRPRPGLELVLALAVYVAFACFLTWPMVVHLGRLFYAQHRPGDPIGTMSFYRELVDHGHNPFLPGTITQLAAPQGQPIPWARDLASLPSTLVQFVFTAVFGQIAANGLYVLLGYVLSAMFMFLFVRRLTGNAWVAALCGWAFAFFPFAVLNGQGHADYIHGWVLVLAVWRLVELQWFATRRNAVLAGLAVILALWWTPYFILLGGIAYLAAMVTALAIAWYDRHLKRALRNQAIVAIMVIVLLAVLTGLAASAGDALGVRSNGNAEFNTYSARWLEYVLPDRLSPLFGSLTSGYLVAHLHGSNPVESTLYLGVTIIFLAGLAWLALARDWLAAPARRALLLLSAIAIVALICSAPPEGTVLGVNLPFPAHFIMKLTTTWRAYSRFVVIVMLAFTALAGIGLAALVGQCSRRVGVAVLLAATVLIPLDLWARLPDRVGSYAVPSVFTKLAREPRGLTAEYPLTMADATFYWDVFYQSAHRMPMINGYLQGSVQERTALELANLADPTTGPRLAALGVRYVVLEAGPSPYGAPPAGTPGQGFQRLASDWFASLYRVTARPGGPAVAAAGPAFAADEIGPGGIPFNWLEQPSGTIALTGTCHDCAGQLEMTISAFAKPRVVTIAAAGHVLFQRQIAGPTFVSLPVIYGPTRELTISASPGPQSIAATVGGHDTRTVSIQVANLRYVWAQQRKGSS